MSSTLIRNGVEDEYCGTVKKISELIEAIRTGIPAVSNLRVALLSTEIGFGIYESHLRGRRCGAPTDSQSPALGVELVKAKETTIATVIIHGDSFILFNTPFLRLVQKNRMPTTD
ncbi:hypothetical protein H8E77_41795 [bacterium]|nr:hypothetical protein [bacterium]